MAVDRHYQITIKGEDVTSTSPIAGDGKESTSAKWQGLVQTPEGRKALGKGMVAYHTVKSFAGQIRSFEIGTMALRTGSNEMQERAQFNYEVGHKLMSVLETTIVSGLLTGGNPAVMAATFVASAAHQMVSYSQNQYKLNLERSVENQSIMRNYIRAGARGSRSRYE